MATTIRITVSRTEDEWKRLQALLDNKTSKKKGVSLTNHIHNEVSTILKDTPLADCKGVRKRRERKDFDISFPDDVAKKIICLADQLGITPSSLIVKLTFDKHILPK